MKSIAQRWPLGGAAALVFLTITACSGGANGSGSAAIPSMMTDTDTLANDTLVDTLTPEINASGSIVTIGSTVDPVNGDQNPYGLDIAKATSGPLNAGDLVVCNFSDSANVEGNGTTIIALHPQAGSSPTHIAQDPSLKGCDAMALSSSDNIWAAAFVANDNPIVTPAGAVVDTLAGGPWHGPFGQAFAPTDGSFGSAAFYESNATDGSIVRINIKPGAGFTYDVIATGFAVNGGAPGNILGPSGLQYDPRRDRLYIVDGADNSLVALRHVSTIPAGGLQVGPNGKFTGPFAHRARLIYSGAPLNGPISSALFSDEHIALGNTLDPNGKNEIVEITPGGHVVAVRNVDTGPAGAIFGMVAAWSTSDRDQFYFNDDNDNTVKLVR